MIFQHTIDKVLSGEKTQTRRIVKPGEDNVRRYSVYSNQPAIETVVNGDRVVYQIGKDYAVQPGRGKPAVARIRVTGLRREDVRTISDDDVKAEGFSSREEFLYAWVSMHDANAAFCEDVIGGWAQWRRLPGEKRGKWRRGGLRDVYEYLYLNSRPAKFYDAWVIEFELCKEAQP